MHTYTHNHLYWHSCIVELISSAWIPNRDILPFEEYKKQYRNATQRSGFSEAVWEAEEDPDLALSDAQPILRELEGHKKKVLIVCHRLGDKCTTSIPHLLMRYTGCCRVSHSCGNLLTT